MNSTYPLPEPGPVVRERSRPGETESPSFVSKKALTNQINFLHFQGQGLPCRFEHGRTLASMTLFLRPEPCLGKNLVFLWPADMVIHAGDWRLKAVTVPMKNARVHIDPHLLAFTARGACLRLPELAIREIIGENEPRRFLDNVCVKIHRDNLSVEGTINGISDNTVWVTVKDGAARDWTGHGFNLVFMKDRQILFAGDYAVIDIQPETVGARLRMSPAAQTIRRFPPKKFRASRLNVLPTPDANAFHPLSGEWISMSVHDLSGAGFSVECGGTDPGLITGMVFSRMELNFAGAVSVSFSAQVVHRSVRKTEDGKSKALFGFAFIDMSVDDHLKLLGILHQKKDHHIRLCQAVDENSLWTFFFETGFIYARKYAALRENRTLIRETYRRLYHQAPSVSRHFIYRDKAEIIGHLSMLRLYHDAWLIHHHAARKHGGIKAGLSVLNHMAWFCYNSLWLEACHMRYLLCYFRPENTFPNFFFNEFANRLNDKAGCSTDTFAYLTARRRRGDPPALPPGWYLTEAGPEDLGVLSRHYTRHSGGLAVDAMDLSPAFSGPARLDKAYHDAGLKKERHLYALKNEDRLIAVALINVTDMALNLSDLSNCLTVFVTDEAGFTRDIWAVMVERLSRLFHQKRFPVLVNPVSYAENRGITFQKRYILWIL
ncbi:MAG: hypothetical protein ACOZBW_02190, partial [Thermodesulfobacteriota bacterium]